MREGLTRMERLGAERPLIATAAVATAAAGFSAVTVMILKVPVQGTIKYVPRGVQDTAKVCRGGILRSCARVCGCAVPLRGDSIDVASHGRWEAG